MPDHKIEPNNWIKRYSDYLFNYTITRVSSREIAQDLVSETFLGGLKSMKNFKGEASERTWLISILKPIFFHAVCQCSTCSVDNNP